MVPFFCHCREYKSTRIKGAEWNPKALSSDKLKKKPEFRIKLPQRIFYNFAAADEPFTYTEFQMPHEEYPEIQQRIQEMFQADPVFPGKVHSEPLKKSKSSKTVADIKKAMIEEKKSGSDIGKTGDKGSKGMIIVGLAMIFLAVYAYLYLKH